MDSAEIDVPDEIITAFHSDTEDEDFDGFLEDIEALNLNDEHVL